MTTVYRKRPVGMCLAEYQSLIENGEWDIYTDYCSIEEKFPLWETAKSDVLRYLPNLLTFKQEDVSTVVLDTTWMDMILESCPKIYHEKLLKLFDDLLNSIRFNFLVSPFFDEFLYQPITRQTLCAMNDKVRWIDKEREFNDKVSIMEYVLHNCGIKETVLDNRLTL